MAVSTDFDPLIVCQEDKTPLRLMSPEMDRKTKGQVMFYCPTCGLKSFGEIAAVRQWLAEQRTPKKRKKG